MTPKEKAKELVLKYEGITDVNFGIRQQKQCALIAVDTIIFELKLRNCSVKYFEEVKQEINKL